MSAHANLVHVPVQDLAQDPVQSLAQHLVQLPVQLLAIALATKAGMLPAGIV